MMSKTIDAWHFLNENRKLQWDHTGPKIKAGDIFYYDKPKEIRLCNRGLHASKKPLDALTFAPGPIICRVRLSGNIVEGDDKLVASQREVLWIEDATNTLHEFACWSAEQALPIFEKKFPKDKRPREAIEATRKWLRGKITDKELSAASAAASDAGSAAAGYARYAASDVAYAASVASVVGLASVAYSDAVYASNLASDAAYTSSDAAQNKQLERVLMELKP